MTNITSGWVMMINDAPKSRWTAKLFGMKLDMYFMLMYLTLRFLPILTLLLWSIAKYHYLRTQIHGKNILNGMISYSTYAFYLGMTFLVMQSTKMITAIQAFYLYVVGLGGLYILFVMATILVALKVGKGQCMSYPFAIQFFSVFSCKHNDVLAPLVVFSNLFLFVTIIIFILGGFK